MPIYTKVEVFISLIKVDERFYSFNYRIRVNGKPHCDGHYSNDHVWGDEKNKFKQILKDGYATDLALERMTPLNQNKPQ